MGLAKGFWVLIHLVLLIEISVGQENQYAPSPMVMVEELGFGAKGVTHYFKKLLEGCDNVGDLDKWIVFMESYLSCEETAWPYKSDEEKVTKTDGELLLDFCEAWPKRFRCSAPMAKKLDVCYGTGSESGKRGSNALRFSDAFARVICRDTKLYIEQTVTSTDTDRNIPADRKSLRCFNRNLEGIEGCMKLKLSLLPASSHCSKLKIVEDCTLKTLQRSCSSQETVVWVSNLMKYMQDESHC